MFSALRAAIGKVGKRTRAVKPSCTHAAAFQDLSRIAMPVQFNEPVSFTQRLVEDLEYSSVLDQAAGEILGL
jgi:hypothetical protein